MSQSLLHTDKFYEENKYKKMIECDVGDYVIYIRSSKTSDTEIVFRLKVSLQVGGQHKRVDSHPDKRKKNKRKIQD